MDAITDDDEDTIPSFDSDTAGASCKTNDDIAASIHVIGQVAAISSMNTVFYLQMILLVLNYLPALKKRKGTKRKREANLRRDRRSVIEFVHGWDDDMFKRQFRLSREDFYEVESAILSNKVRHGYDLEQHYKYARLSSGSPISIELRLLITLRLLSGASYLDMIWYGVSLRSIPSIFWETICDIDGAVDNINFPQDEGSMMQLSENWARKRRERHGFATNMGTVLAVDGYVIEIKKPTATDLDGQEVSCYRNRKGFWGLITQVGCDCNGKVRFVQTDWPGATNDLSCFRETPLFQALRSRAMPEWAHIVADEAYTPLSGECNFQILTPYSQHQLNSAKSQDWQNLQDWLARRKENPLFTGPKPVPQYWKMRSFNHELSSERITIERVLGMMVRRFGMIWRPMEIHFGKVPTVFRVICKLHNICMDSWLRKNPRGILLDAEAPPFGDDENLWNTFDITVGLDDSYDQPTDDDIQERLENNFNNLSDRRRVYAARNIPRRDALMEELYVLGVRFNHLNEIY